MNRRHRLLGFVSVIALVLSACSGTDGGSTTTTTTADDPTTTSTVDAAVTTTMTPPEPHPLDMTSQEICDTVPSEAVGEALSVTVDDVVPFEDGSPQCSYQFLLENGSVNNAIVNVPTINGNLGGASGDAGFDFVLSLYEDGNYEVSEIETGDRAVVFSSPPDTDAGVHVGVIRVGERVIVTIVSVGLVEYDAFLALNDVVVEYLAPAS